MKLYLSSYRLGAGGDHLLSLMGNGRRAAIIGNALDHVSDDARREYEARVYDTKREFSALGIATQDLDLRRYFGNPDGLLDTLRQFDLVWILGGNSFLLRRAMKQSGFDKVVSEMLNANEIVYGGFSAGAVVATPTLRSMELMDDPLQLAPGYDPNVIWDGLGLVNFSIVPHYRSDHHEAEVAEKAVSFLQDAEIPFKAMRDGEVIVKDGLKLRFISIGSGGANTR